MSDGERVDKDCLSYWFPRLLDADVPVPRTEIVRTDCKLEEILDGKMPDGFREFESTLKAAAAKIGYPLFLRTGHTSGKHDWERTCYVDGPEKLIDHMASLVEFSHLCDFFGLPHQVWVVREFLHLKHEFLAFRNMPVAVEYRAFVEGGQVLCHHRYWPDDSIRSPSCENWKELLDGLYDAFPFPERVARQVASAVAGNGAWSVDLALGDKGTWYVTDMATAERSFHWAGCPVGKERWPQCQRT